MKHVILSLILLFTLHTTVAQIDHTHKEANKTILTKAPKAVSVKFAKEYPGVRPVWKMDGSDYEATYSDAETKLNHLVVYNKEGELLKKEDELNYSQYPVKINQYYSVRFPEEKIQILKCEAPNGDNYYFAKHKDKIIKFDTDGNYISDKREKAILMEKIKW